ncbi:glutathione S-transferase isoform X1 [Hordeum vulgare subsp. vulgare]|uniref:glutathione S-transferase isoform X1 n=1 Tax=Hordeum vulgare subsp. vulgare TaxID=112509 RepID=UPI001D1A3313|nr:glutathione S-transferase isoform X1 [Hordeum vulgare subsp. vulgare]
MATAKPILYGAWISSCSHRVRIALNLKGVDYEYKAVNPRTDPDYEKINPIKYIPALVDGDFVLSDSLAIILYLEDKYPQHPLMPKDIKMKALDLQIANIVCSSIQPLQGYGVIGLHEGRLSSDESLEVVQRYIDKGFRAIEKLLDGCDSKYCVGDEVHLGDVFLAPQIHAAINRFQIDMLSFSCRQSTQFCGDFTTHTWKFRHFKLHCPKISKMHLQPDNQESKPVTTICV